MTTYLCSDGTMTEHKYNFYFHDAWPQLPRQLAIVIDELAGIVACIYTQLDGESLSSR